MTNNIRGVRWLWAMGTALLVAACGGGGGGDDGYLRVDVVYGDNGVDLFAAATVRPTLSGFDGHDASCNLAWGSLPPGMELRRDCSITGRPTQPGIYSFTVRVSAEGVTGTVDFSGNLTVRAPMAVYVDRSFRFPLTVGAAVEDAPQLVNWSVPRDESLAWSYTLASGELPPGLALDPVTGTIVGTPTTQGNYSAEIRSRLVTAYGGYDLQVSTYHVSVDAASFGYGNDGGTGSTNTHLIAYVSQPFHASPFASIGSSVGGFSLSGGTLPTGLSLDVTTGVVSGTPTVRAITEATVDATLTTGAASRVAQASLPIDAVYPTWVHYNGGRWIAATTGAPAVAVPTMDQLSPLALGTVDRSYTPGACSLPPGVNFDPVTGVASGVPTATGNYQCTVTATLTHRGVTWTQDAYIGFQVN